MRAPGENCYYEAWTVRMLSTVLGLQFRGPKILQEFDLALDRPRLPGRRPGQIEVDGHYEVDPATFVFVEAESSRPDFVNNVVKVWRWVTGSPDRRVILIEVIDSVGWAQFHDRTAGRARWVAAQAELALGKRFRCFFIKVMMCHTPLDDPDLIAQLEPVRLAIGGLR